MRYKANKIVKKIEKVKNRVDKQLTGKQSYDIGLIAEFTKEMQEIERLALQSCTDDEIENIKAHMEEVYGIINGAYSITIQTMYRGGT